MADGDRCTRPPAFPARPDNRPALPRIGYRIGSYSDFRESLMRRLDATPELSHWTHREPDDPAIALLECAAVLGDILTFYQDLYANEAYLRTASWQTSIAELVRLLGYRLAPGLGGAGTFAFEIRPGEPVTVPPGFALQVELDGADEAAVLETVAAVLAHPELSRFTLHRPLSLPQVTSGTTELWIRSDPPVELAADDRLLIATPFTGEPHRLSLPQVVIVEEVGSLHDATIVRIKGAVQQTYTGALVAFKLGRTFRHFGHNAPPEEVKIVSEVTTSTAISYCRRLGGTTTIGSGPLAPTDLPLATAIDDFAAGGQVICSYTGGCSLKAQDEAAERRGTGAVARMDSDDGPLGDPPVIDVPDDLETDSDSDLVSHETVVRTVAAVRADSLRVGSLSGASTVLGLERNLASGSATTADMRTFEIHELTSPRMEAAARPVDKDVQTGRDLLFRGPASAAAALAARRVVLATPDGGTLATVVSAVETNTAGVPQLTGLHRVTLAATVRYADFPQEPDEATMTVVYGNLADAEQGKSEPEVILGSGDGRVAFQTFKLPKTPLTYHHRASQSPPHVPELELSVSGRTWTRVDSLFGQGPDAEVYVVREDGEGSSWVQFGDGRLFGVRLPSGPGNVRALLRTGLGAHGALKENTKVQPGRLDRLDAVQLPGVISGGAQPEAADVARAAAPGRVQGLGRLVGLSDYESEALAIAGVALASAAWELVDGVPALTVTVLMEGGREQELAAVAASLRTAARERGPDRFEIDVRQGSFRDVRLRAEVAVASGLDEQAVLAAVADALGAQRADGSRPAGGLFSLQRRRFGEAEYLARATGVIQNVAGVAWTQIVGFGALAGPPRPAAGRIDCPADSVLRLAQADLVATATGAQAA